MDIGAAKHGTGRRVLIDINPGLSHRAIGTMLILFGPSLARVVTMRMDEFREGRNGMEVVFARPRRTCTDRPLRAGHPGPAEAPQNS